MKKKILSLLLAILTLLSTVTPAFAGSSNATGSGGNSGNNTNWGWYNPWDALWKVSVYVGMNSKYNAASSSSSSYSTKSEDGKYWYKYGQTIYVAKSDVSSLEKNVKKAWFVKENKIELLRKSSNPKNVSMEVKTYSSMQTNFLWLSDAPAVPIDNQNTIGRVKEWFSDADNLIKILRKIASIPLGRNPKNTAEYLTPIANKSFTIDGVKKVAVGSNGWHKTTGGTTTADYNGKAITLFPFSGSNENSAAVDWLIVYEPVIVFHPYGGFSDKSCVAFTPTEMAIAMEKELFSFSGLDNVTKYVFPSAVYLERSWLGYPKGTKLEGKTSTEKVFSTYGWGMRHTGVAKRTMYDLAISVKTNMKTAKAGQTVTVTYTVKNNSNTVKNVPIYMYGRFSGRYYVLGDETGKKITKLTKGTYKTSDQIYNAVYSNGSPVCKVGAKSSKTYTFKVQLDNTFDAETDFTFCGKVNWSKRNSEYNKDNNEATTVIQRKRDAEVSPTIKINVVDKTG